MNYHFLSPDDRQGLRYEICRQLEEQHYRLTLRLRQLEAVVPDDPAVQETKDQMTSIEAQLEAVKEPDDPR